MLDSTTASTGTTTSWPAVEPAVAVPTARPRFLSKVRLTMVETAWVAAMPKPSPANPPKATRNSQGMLHEAGERHADGDRDTAAEQQHPRAEAVDQIAGDGRHDRHGHQRQRTAAGDEGAAPAEIMLQIGHGEPQQRARGEGDAEHGKADADHRPGGDGGTRAVVVAGDGFRLHGRRIYRLISGSETKELSPDNSVGYKGKDRTAEEALQAETRLL